MSNVDLDHTFEQQMPADGEAEEDEEEFGEAVHEF